MTLKTLLLVGSMAALAGATAPVAIRPALADGYPACLCKPARPVVKRKVVKRRPAPVKVVYVDRPVDRVVEKIVERRVEVPVDRIVEKIVERPVERIVEKVVERRVEVPVERVVEKIVKVPVDRPVDRIVEKVVERRVEVPVDRVVEKVVERPVYVDRVIDRPVYIERPMPAPLPELRRVYVEPVRPMPAHGCDCDARVHDGGAYGSSQIVYDSRDVSGSAVYESSQSGYSYGYESRSAYGDASYGAESGGGYYGSNARYGVGGGWHPQGALLMPGPDLSQGHDGYRSPVLGETYDQGPHANSRGHTRPRRPDRYGQ